MNKQRRIALQEINDKLRECVEGIEALREEEQEYYDNIPENLHQSERAAVSEDVISALESACSSLEDAINYIDEASQG